MGKTETSGFPVWMTDEAISTLKSGFLKKEKNIYMAWNRIIECSVEKLKKFNLTEEFYESYSKDLFTILNNGWLGLATPVLTEMGRKNGGLPISCYSLSVQDSIREIFDSLQEAAVMTKNTGGVGIYVGNLRGANESTTTGSIASGPVSFSKIFDITASTVAQGPRRGSFAFYLPIDHKDIKQFLLSKDHTQGDSRRWIDSNIAVSITNSWMRSMLAGDVEKRELFAEVIKTRLICGSPYLFFVDNVNDANPPAYKKNNLKVETSNICSEIMLHTDADHSFVCCLSSLNLDKYDEWKDYYLEETGFSVPELTATFLDTVLEEFIEKAASIEGMEKAVRSAIKGRAIGIGVMGLASLYQKRNLAWYEPECYDLNVEIHKYIFEESKKASKWMGMVGGIPEWCEGTNLRNTHTIAVAPTRTNSSICGAVSMGIEPIESNIYVAKQDKGIFVRKNPNLEAVLEKHKKNTPEVWELISKDKGSVKSLDFLTKHEKHVFRTAREIDQFDLLRQAADRQKYIDQGQSLNLFVDTYSHEHYLVELHIAAWMLGLKSVYYLRTRSKQTLDTLNYIITKRGCVWCDKLKEELVSRGVSFAEISISEAKRKGLWKSSYKTTPQLFFDGEHIGGYAEYMKKYIHGNEGLATPGLVDGSPYIGPQECTACEG